MRYTVEPRCIKNFVAMTKLPEKRWVTCLLWRAVAPFLVGVCYVGLLFATLFCELLPFQIIAWCGIVPPMKLYWVLAAIVLAAIVVVCCMSGIGIYRRLLTRRIEIDQIVLFVGSLLALGCGSWLYVISKT
jgi:hypothetical protein